jgi:hypothetical protein
MESTIKRGNGSEESGQPRKLAPKIHFHADYVAAPLFLLHPVTATKIASGAMLKRRRQPGARCDGT